MEKLRRDAKTSQVSHVIQKIEFTDIVNERMSEVLRMMRRRSLNHVHYYLLILAQIDGFHTTLLTR
jgi:hypothetical protein